MSNDPYRSSGSSRSSGQGFRPDSSARSPQPSGPSNGPSRPPAPRRSPILPVLLALGAGAAGLLLWRGQAPATGGTGGQPETRAQNSIAAGTTNSGSASRQEAASGAPTQSDKLHVLVAGDVSRSVDAGLRQSAMDGLKFALRQALPAGTPLHFVFYDRDARTRPGQLEFFEPRDLDEVSNDFVKYAPRPEKGTRQALALSRLRREADALAAGTPVAFVLLTDGEDQDAPATTREAQRMAAQPNFRGLLVVGAQMESRTRVYLRDKLDASLAPLANRKVVCGPEVSDREADQFAALLGP